MLKYLLSVVVVLLTFLSALLPADASETSGVHAQISQELVKNGDMALSEGQAFDALHIFESALVSDPKNVAAYIGLGQAHAALDRKKTAMDYYNAALDVDPNSTKALELQSLGFLEQGKITAAERNLTRLQRLCAQGCASLEHVNEAIDATLRKTQEAILGENDQQALVQENEGASPAQN